MISGYKLTRDYVQIQTVITLENLWKFFGFRR